MPVVLDDPQMGKMNENPWVVAPVNPIHIQVFQCHANNGVFRHQLNIIGVSLLYFENWSFLCYVQVFAVHQFPLEIS